MVIWKYSLPIVDQQTVTMPTNAQILSVQQQGDNRGLQLWAIVDPNEQRRERRTIEIVGTGNPMQDVDSKGLCRAHLATVQTGGGVLVWHVFELI